MDSLQMYAHLEHPICRTHVKEVRRRGKKRERSPPPLPSVSFFFPLPPPPSRVSTHSPLGRFRHAPQTNDREEGDGRARGRVDWAAAAVMRLA